MEKKTIIPLRWFIGFLCIMGMLTFISRQVYAQKLPIVGTEKFSQQNIIHTVTASGSVQYDSVTPVFLEQGIMVEKVCVHTGDSVKKGDTLAKLNMQSLERSVIELEAQSDEIIKGGTAFDTEEDTPVFTESGMRIKSVEVSVGDSVKKGDVLMSVDSDRLLEYINSLEADRNKDMISKNSAVNALNAPIPTDGEDLMREENREKADTLNISIDQQQKLINRYLKVYQNGGNIIAEKDGIVTKLDIKTGDITSDSAIMVISGSSTPGGSLAAKNAQLEELKALIAADGEINSPCEGTVSRVLAEPGTPSGDAAAFFITDTTGGKLYFNADIAEDSAKRLSVGDKVTLLFRNGRIRIETQIGSMIRTETGFRAQIPLDPETFPEAGELDNAEIGEMRAAPRSADTFWCINKEAVYGSGADRYIYVAREAEGFFGKEYHAVKQNITVIDENDDIVGISAPPLAEGEEVIVTTDKTLSDSLRVRLAKDIRRSA